MTLSVSCLSNARLGVEIGWSASLVLLLGISQLLLNCLLIDTMVVCPFLCLRRDVCKSAELSVGLLLTSNGVVSVVVFSLLLVHVLVQVYFLYLHWTRFNTEHLSF